MLSEKKRLSLACPTQCPAAAWSWGGWELWDVAEQGITAAVHPSLPCCLLCTQVCGQSRTPLGALQGKGETSDPAGGLTAPLPPFSATWAQQGSPGTQGFPRNGSREQGWKAQRLMRGNGLLHCRGQQQNHKEALVPEGKSMDQVAFQNSGGQATYFCFTSCIHL